MKKILVIVFGLFVVVGLLNAQEAFEVIDEGEIEGYFSYVSIACENPETALTFVGAWTSSEDEDSWVEITTEEIDRLTMLDSKSLFESELGERIGVYLYLYTESQVKITAVYENGSLYVTSDSEETIKELKKNKDLLIKGLFDI